MNIKTQDPYSLETMLKILFMLEHCNKCITQCDVNIILYHKDQNVFYHITNFVILLKRKIMFNDAISIDKSDFIVIGLYFIRYLEHHYKTVISWYPDYANWLSSKDKLSNLILSKNEVKQKINDYEILTKCEISQCLKYFDLV